MTSHYRSWWTYRSTYKPPLILNHLIQTAVHSKNYKTYLCTFSLPGSEAVLMRVCGTAIIVAQRPFRLENQKSDATAHLAGSADPSCNGGTFSTHKQRTSECSYIGAGLRARRMRRAPMYCRRIGREGSLFSETLFPGRNFVLPGRSLCQQLTWIF